MRNIRRYSRSYPQNQKFRYIGQGSPWRHNSIDPTRLTAFRRRNLDPTRLMAFRRRNLDPTRLVAFRGRRNIDPTEELDPTRLIAFRRHNSLDPTRLVAFRNRYRRNPVSGYHRNPISRYHRNPISRYRRNPDPDGKPWGPQLYNPLTDSNCKFKNERHYKKMISKLRRNPW